MRMTLNQKIFITFFISVTTLLCTTLYLIDTQAEKLEIDRIIADLNKTQAKFQHDLETRQQHIQTLSHIITSDQKFRSFLSQIKDNFYPFTAEIGRDTRADFVFMIDDAPSIRAVYSKHDSITLALKPHFAEFEIEAYLESGLKKSKMIHLETEVYSSHFIPLKENRMDDYAVGLIIVINQVNNAWMTTFLTTNAFFQAVFFSDKQVVASNTTAELATTILANRQTILDSGQFLFDQQRFIGKQVLFNAGDSDAGYILSANLDQTLAAFKQLQQQILITGGGILLLGSLLFLWVSRRITQPLRLITRGTLAIEKGDYQHRIDYKSEDEVGQLATAFNIMSEGLEEKERIRRTFNQYVDPTIVSELLNNPDDHKLGGVRKQQSVLFSDIAGFTGFSEKLPAEILVKVLNNYLTAMTQEISLQQGILDKFIGDAIMAFWSPQLCDYQHAQRACQTALNMQKSLIHLRPLWEEHYGPHITIRIGIATGEMIVGNIGSEQARSYTCIGDKVNYSSRLESLNKHYRTQIMIDQETVENIEGFVIRELDTVRVKGRKEGENIYELVGVDGEVDLLRRETLSAYHQGLTYYRQAKFRAAATIFTALNEDAPSQIMLKRCLYLQQYPPENWEGIHSMLDK
ncbi:MAG: adenylate/guanylate cyclase domain-containing protein [Methylococcales bacterium]|nr:adenylate/guanylate cyclase domain-containing protein [Methylococcales bacterium]